MPPFARTQWVSTTARNAWEPRIHKASSCYHELEIATIQAGLRRATTTHLNPQNLSAEIRMWARRGLAVIPTTAVGAYSGLAHSHPPVIEGKRWSWYAPVGKTPADAEAFAHASDIGDHRAIGDLLGYPRCCQDFFSTVWMDGYVDPVWQACIDTSPEHVAEKTDTYLRLKNTCHHELFDGLRYNGVRLVPQLGCSMDCKPSIKLAEDWIQVARDENIDGLEELMLLLQMPVRWSCLKGIAIVDTPIYRIVTNSMPCYPEYVVEKEGLFVPEEGTKALRFPWDKAPRSYDDLVELH